MCRYTDVMWTICLHVERVDPPILCEATPCAQREDAMELRIGWCPSCEGRLRVDLPSDDVDSLNIVRRLWVAVYRDKDLDLTPPVEAGLIYLTPMLDVIGGKVNPLIKKADEAWARKMQLKLREHLEPNDAVRKQKFRDGFVSLLAKKWTVRRTVKRDLERATRKIALDAVAETVKVRTGNRVPDWVRHSSRLRGDSNISSIEWGTG